MFYSGVTLNSNKGFDPRWEEIFKEHQWGKYPCEEVIRVTAKNFFKQERAKIKILDLGCGGGATTWFLSREGFDCYAIDGSQSAIDQAKTLLKRENLSAKFSVENFIKLNFEKNTFDAVYDLNSIQHNKFEDVEKIYQEIFRVLKPNGIFFTMCLSDQTTVGPKSIKIAERTFSTLDTLNHDVNVHLFNEQELRQLAQTNELINLESIIKQSNNKKVGHFLATYRKNN
jgi:2-polyprenyl-3-methyl-5-hydroxy-6-metoxy-1,4-benzoquinol methylase